MNKYKIKILLFGLICLMGMNTSCSNSSKNATDAYSKDELRKMFVEFSNKEMNKIHEDMDSLMKVNFTFQEQEGLIIDRMTFYKEGDQKINDIKDLFATYRQTYGGSFLDENAGNQDEFMQAFIQKKTQETINE